MTTRTEFLSSVYVSLGDQVNVEWTSLTGPHSCSFDVNWLIKHDYTTPGVHEDRKEKEKPLVAVRKFNN